MFKFVINSNVNIYLSSDSVRRAESVARELDKLTTDLQAENACFRSSLDEYFEGNNSLVSMGDLGYLESEVWEAEERLEAFRDSHRRDVETLEFIRRFGG